MSQLENSSNDDVLSSWLVENKVSRNKAARVPSVINTRPLPQHRDHHLHLTTITQPAQPSPALLSALLLDGELRAEIQPI